MTISALRRMDETEGDSVTTNRRITSIGVLTLSLVLIAGAVLAKNTDAKQAEEQLEFGYKAAKRGYWQEALTRFEAADRLTPNQPKILNNIAVALEANGRFDEARTTYEAGLALDPSNPALKKNMKRFEEFYQTFVTSEDEDDESPDDSGEERPDES
jgi:Flp pilus assembly protein TadD